MEIEIQGDPAPQQGELGSPQMSEDQVSPDLRGTVVVPADDDNSGHPMSQMEEDSPAAVHTNTTFIPAGENMDEPEEGEIDGDSEGSAIDFS